jgi:hypothetical protein
MHRHIVAVAVCGLLLAASRGSSIGAVRPVIRLPVDSDACALLTAAEVSKALGVTSLPGERVIPASPKMCTWSDDAQHDINHRRVTVSIVGAAGFQVGKSSKRITIEPVSGIGDEAYYEIPGSGKESPFLFVRKGSAAFSIRVLNGLKLKAFTLQEEKDKESDLAKAAVSRL